MALGVASLSNHCLSYLDILGALVFPTSKKSLDHKETAYSINWIKTIPKVKIFTLTMEMIVGLKKLLS